MNCPYKKILVIKIRAMGDTLLATPTITALKEACPQASLSVLVSPEGREVLEDHPHIDHLMTYDKHMSISSYFTFVKKLRKQRYDLVIALHASFRTALMAFFTGARHRVVHNHSGANFLSTIPIKAKKEAKSTIARDFDTVHALGVNSIPGMPSIYLNDLYHKEADRFIKDQNWPADMPFMILAPGAGKEVKQWPQADVLIFLQTALVQSKMNWVLLAGPKEKELAASVNHHLAGKVPVFQGSIKAAAALISRAIGMITADSGPKHIACALGTRTLTLWTDEPVAEWHPYDMKNHRLIKSPTGMVKDITPDQLWQAGLDHFPDLQKKTT